ncbi:two-component system, NarL family, sensor histidine kinase DesK [Saccharopolyspora antimicrobica]|uniref:Two-component system sensor histidine kinase DesK n=2 Tax=Saccharopolyspora antimicrobica TaxID=455193 RepID=A0A1I5D6S0_9PSEU|nr:two-component system sensor histidine kinase DesK [Saccharopolyspora antimicrobica]SFN94531.1 two-component system, NarL family, sensor histidine kinase DesK [Saccharopolyspora antimicrobica]
MRQHARTRTRGQLRKTNLTMFLPLLAVVGAVTVAVDARNWWEAVVLAAGVVATLVAFVRWAADDLLPVAPATLAVTAAVWAFGALAGDGRMAFFGISFVGALVVPKLSRWRGWAAVALAGYVAAVGAARMLVSHQEVPEILIRYVLIPTGVTVVVVGFMFPNKRFYDIVAELEEAREREAELAVIRERVRFAGDLHDIQGHTLHVVKLKTALARKLVDSDAERAKQELREIHDLVSDTITQTKELAYAQRRLNLSAELENARNLFEAAGIDVRVDREADVDQRVGELLGQVLRETTTNILRHAQATQVRIALSASSISIVNDGAKRAPVPELRGLAALAQRVAANGGELSVDQHDGEFRTAAVFPNGAEAPG